jgi:hypothetical protein
MDRSGQARKWAMRVFFLFLAVGAGYAIHELAHYGMYKAYGYTAVIDWKQGMVAAVDSLGEIITSDRIPPEHRIPGLLAGPLSTLLLAAVFTGLYLRHQASFLFFAFGMMGAVSRFNMLIDGFNSDEGKIAAQMFSSYGPIGGMTALSAPLLVWTTSIILAAILTSRQTFFQRTYWAIPLWALTNFGLVLVLRLLMVVVLVR